MPYLPIAVVAHDNSKETFNQANVANNWSQLWRLLRAAGVHCIGQVSDGAPALRASVLSLCKPKKRILPRDHVVVTHPLIELAMIPEISGEVLTCKGCSIDWLHIGWRLRVQALSGSRTLVLFGRLIVNTDLLWMLQKQSSHNRFAFASKLVINTSDLDASDKNNFGAMCKLADIKYHQRTGKAEAVSTIRDALGHDVDYMPLLWYVEFLHRFLSIFMVDTLSPSEVVCNAGYCIAFLGYWDMCNQHIPGCTKYNFLTAETKKDVLIACNMVVLMTKFVRMWCMHHGTFFKFAYGRISSRFCEYAFQFLRCADHTSSTFSVMSGMQLVDIYLNTLVMELEGGLKIPESKRHNARGIDSVYKAPEVPAGGASSYYPSDDEIHSLLDRGVYQVRGWHVGWPLSSVCPTRLECIQSWPCFAGATTSEDRFKFRHDAAVQVQKHLDRA
jgi:hypothetical protein